jgi:UDP-N-acetyl-D-mannosaminuronic acid dehydrogenase
MLENYKNKIISVIGLGYIGLPTATLFAYRGIQVRGVDINQTVVETINSGKIHIVEPDLDRLVHAAVNQGYLSASTQVETADVFLIAVPTPFKEGHKPDLSYVTAAAKSIASVLKKGDLVILESTSPVGTTEEIATLLAHIRPDLSFPQQQGEKADVQIAYCPERVLPSHIIRELVANDRIIGGMTPRCSQAASDCYKIFVEGECIVTDTRTAEMCKLTENAFRDVNIAFANELSMICDKVNIDVWTLIELANKHPRVNILQPGAGVGGHCIAVDPWFIVDKTPDEARLIQAARQVNDYKPRWVVSKIREAVDALKAKGLQEENITIALLGLAFKPNIDDLRESPAVEVAKLVSDSMKVKLLAVEPHISTLPAFLQNIELCDLDKAVQMADIIVVNVKHKEFYDLLQGQKFQKIILNIVGI